MLPWRHKIKVKERTWRCMGDNCRAEEQDGLSLPTVSRCKHTDSTGRTDPGNLKKPQEGIVQTMWEASEV